MSSSSRADLELDTCIRQQDAVRELGRRALGETDVDGLLRGATERVAETLDADLVAAFQRGEGGADGLLLRAGVGWREGAVGAETVPADPESPAGYTLANGRPIVVDDLRADSRVARHELLADHDVASGISAVVGPPEEPWGVLAAYATGERAFTEHDGVFLESVANVVASAVETERAERRLESELDEVYGRISDAVYALDDEWRFTYANDRAEAHLGRSAEELRGELLWDVFPDVEGSALEERFREAMETQEPVSFERHSEPLGIWAEVDAYPSETGLSVYFRDVTERKEIERELRERERRLSTLIENVPGMVYRCRNERGWPLEFVSEGVREVTGYDPGTLESGELSFGADVVVEEDRDELWDAIQRGLAEDGSFTVTYRIETLDGEVRWVRERGRGIYDEFGDIEALEGVVIDVTEDKEREQELKRFEVLVEESRDVNVVLGPDGTYRYVTPSMENVFGHDPEGIVGENAFDYVHPEDRERVAEEFAEMVDDPGREPTVEYRFRRADGSWAVIESRGRNLLDEPAVEGIVVYSREVTERKEHERELRRYETIVEAVEDGVYVVDDDGRFTMVNDAYAEMVGYDREELVGEHVSLVVDDDVVERAQRAEAAMEEGTTDSAVIEAELETASGDRLPAEATFAILPTTAGPEHRVGVARDVSDRRDRERELRQKERRYEAVFQDPNILVGLLEPDGTVLDINGTAMQYIDADLAAVTGEPFWETPWWGDGDGVSDDVEEWVERAAAGEYVDFEADLTRPDGERYAISGYFRPVTNDDGEVVSIIVSDRDITERKRRERELEESEQRYRTLVENFPNGAVALVDEDLTYRTVGGTPVDEVGDSAAALEGKTVREAISPELADVVEPRYRAALDGESSTFEHEHGGRHSRFHIFPVRDDEGDVFAAIGMSQDVTERKRMEAERREVERHYRTIAEYFPNGIVTLFDEDLEYTLAAGQAFADLPVDPAELEGSHFAEAWDEGTAAELRPAFEAALAGEERSVELAYAGREWVVRTVPITDEDGAVFAGLTIAQDITERKRFEEAIHALHDTTRELFHAESTEAVGRRVVSAASDVLGLSDAALYLHDEERGDLYPASKATQMGMMWDDLPRVPPGDDSLVGHVYATGESARWDDIRDAPQFIGGETDMRAGVFAPVGDHGAVFAGSNAVGAFDERTLQLLELLAANAEAAFDRIERERELEESEHRYRTLVENFPNGSVGLFNEDLAYTAVGGQFVDALDIEPDDRVGRSIDELHPDGLVEEIEPHFRAALDGEPDSFDIEFRGHHLYANTLPVRNADDEVYAGMLVVQDVTERREYERRLEASNERLEQFAYAASHDLQEPLRMVSSYLQLIEQRYGEDLDADGREYIEFAVDGADRMRAMIDGLLQYSRVDTGGDPFEPVDLDDVIADVRRDLGVKIEESDAEITTDPLPRVQGDGGQLTQVFQNLLSNAIEYSGDDPPRIHVSAERGETSGDEWVLSVRDEGIGIDPDEADRIFEVFQSLHDRSEHAGTGIGLALCERIVERHGGDIWVESEPGEGATFSFTLLEAGDTDE